jgi:hypothetical protein
MGSSNSNTRSMFYLYIPPSRYESSNQTYRNTSETKDNVAPIVTLGVTWAVTVTRRRSLAPFKPRRLGKRVTKKHMTAKMRTRTPGLLKKSNATVGPVTAMACLCTCTWFAGRVIGRPSRRGLGSLVRTSQRSG